MHFAAFIGAVFATMALAMPVADPAADADLQSRNVRIPRSPNYLVSKTSADAHVLRVSASHRLC